jgi:hypothetical protein
MAKFQHKKINLKIVKKKNKILFEINHWIHLTKNWKTIQFLLFVWQKISCKWSKNWCLPIYIYMLPNRYILKTIRVMMYPWIAQLKFASYLVYY